MNQADTAVFTDADDVVIVEDRKNVCEVLDAETVYESPIDLNISRAIPVDMAPLLNWVNFDLPPKKMKITNTGHTVILSGKWGQERPYITNGVLTGKYVFSQLHLHWGINDMEGSEHTIDGSRFPAEIHVVLFKSCYLTQESALKERDGIVILVYILKLQDPPNLELQPIVDALPAVAKAHTSTRILSVQLNYLINIFQSDYLMYRGSIVTADCVHQIFWLITRLPIGVSYDQMDSFRFLLDNDDEIIRRNYRPIQPINDRHVFHILPSPSKYATLLQNASYPGDKQVTPLYRIEVLRNIYGVKILPEDEVRKKKEAKLKTVNPYIADGILVNRTISVISKLTKYMDCIC